MAAAHHSVHPHEASRGPQLLICKILTHDSRVHTKYSNTSLQLLNTVPARWASRLERLPHSSLTQIPTAEPTIRLSCPSCIQLPRVASPAVLPSANNNECSQRDYNYNNPDRQSRAAYPTANTPRGHSMRRAIPACQHGAAATRTSCAHSRTPLHERNTVARACWRALASWPPSSQIAC